MIKNILLIEDEVIIGMAMAAELEDHGYHIVDISCSGEEALKKMQQSSVDLVILDIKINGRLDGLETLREIRKEKNPHVIVVSGNSDASTCQKIKGMSVDGSLVKPVNTKELLDLITTIEQTGAK